MFVSLGRYAWLSNLEWLRGGLHRLPAAEARLLARRWGLDGGNPRSIAELAREEGVPPMEMVRRLQAAEAQLLRVMGGASGSGPAPETSGPATTPRPGGSHGTRQVPRGAGPSGRPSP